ncbi:MAG: hypothetical protein NTV73_08780 [Hyphomicrobiales bacterium]|nr:hypothetical protein [Hyphomicrobiales bacterium]
MMNGLPWFLASAGVRADGDIMPGTGGARKLRFAGRGKGKSGGYRIITFYADADTRSSCSMFTARTRKRGWNATN